MTPAQFRKLVWAHYTAHGRHDLPWRKTTDPYRILVSEIMLQQTQVERVIPFYKEFLTRFPTVRKLAAAPLADVLRAWQGLGYNRRAKMLWEAAKIVVKKHKGKMPADAEALDRLPGVGPYTAQAVAAFAANTNGVFIETNLRTVVMHHFFPDKKKVSDAEILIVLEKAQVKGRAREWYSALMDYGSFLKRSGVRLNTKSKTYTKQSTFEGSARQARGAILKALAKKSETGAHLMNILGASRRTQLQAQLALLTKEGLIEVSRGKFRLPK